MSETGFGTTATGGAGAAIAIAAAASTAATAQPSAAGWTTIPAIGSHDARGSAMMSA